MKKLICSVLLICLLVSSSSMALAATATLEDFQGAWEAVILSYDGEKVDAKQAGFDMRIEVTEDVVVLSSTVMGISRTSYIFEYNGDMVYSEGSNIAITISYVDEDTLMLNLISDGLDVDFTMKRSQDGFNDMTLTTSNGLYAFKFVEAKTVEHDGKKFIGLYVEFSNNSSKYMTLINAIPYPWAYQNGEKLETYGSTRTIKGVSQNPEVAPGKTELGVILFVKRDNSVVEVKTDNGYTFTMELSD